MTPQTLTPAELDELAALEAKATPGEWKLLAQPLSSDYLTSVYVEGACVATTSGARERADAALIAALRNAAPALLSMARRLGELQYRWGEFSASNLANLHSLNAQLTAATARAAELDAALTTALADAEMAEHAHDACEELLTAATDRAEALQAEVTAAYDRGLAHGKGPNWQQGYYNLADGVLLLTKERDTADARAQAAEKRCGEYEKALRRIADGDAGHQGSFDWPEFYESIRKHAREALAVAQAVAPLRRENEVLRSNGDHLSSENASLASQVESMAMRIESLAEELAKPEDVRLREVLDALDGRAVIFDGLGERVGHLLDEMDEWIARAGEAERAVNRAEALLLLGPRFTDVHMEAAADFVLDELRVALRGDVL